MDQAFRQMPIKRFLRTGELDEADLPGNIAALLDDAGQLLDSSFSHDICGEVVFEGEDGKIYVGTVEFSIAEINPKYLADLLKEDEDGD